VPVESAVRGRRFQRPIADAGRHVIGPQAALSGRVTVARVPRTVRGRRRAVRQAGLRAVGQYRGAAVQRAQPGLPSQVQRVAFGQPDGTAAQRCERPQQKQTKTIASAFKRDAVLPCPRAQTEPRDARVHRVLEGHRKRTNTRWSARANVPGITRPTRATARLEGFRPRKDEPNGCPENVNGPARRQIRTAQGTRGGRGRA